VTTLATCWKVTRTDAQVFAFTDHDRDLVVDGVTYESAVGFVPSAVARGVTLQADNQQLAGIIDSGRITQADLRTGKWNGARVELIEADWQTETKARTLLVGFLGNVEISSGQYRAELSSMEIELSKPIGRTIQLRCDADLGDSRCGYTLTADSLSVTSVTSDIDFADSVLASASGYYNGGKLTWLTGNNAGLTFDIKRSTLSSGNRIELWEPPPYPVEVGDTADIYRGCDKTAETCKNTFNNKINFRGADKVPSVKDLVAGDVA
jgi:uncharacterized phage protein (TIGR02218 family)